MPKFSIIIRTKNEESWIKHCLNMVFSQTITDIEVIIVDNNSSDKTVEIATTFPVEKILSIDKFIPGKALNDGVRESCGEFLVFLSAHCIPKSKNWLEMLFNGYLSEPNLAGVYGRQLPLSFTQDADKRDLMIVFGMDRKIQHKDYFFHNANSLVPRSIWNNYPFDEEVTNIEDRVWGKEVINAGYKILYEPEASVYHYHGLHQNNKPDRVRGVVSIIEKVDGSIINELPNSLLPQSINVASIIPISEDIDDDPFKFNNAKRAIDKLRESKYIKNIYILSKKRYPQFGSALWINRAEIENEDCSNVEEVLANCLASIEKNENPDAILYINIKYEVREDLDFDELVNYKQYGGYDVVFPGTIDYGHYWYLNEKMEFIQTDTSLAQKNKRNPIYKALYGLGCLSSCRVIRGGKLVSGKIGIVPLNPN